MIPRLFVPIPLELGQLARLPRESDHYLTRVLRLAIGATVVLFNGNGGSWRTTLTRITPVCDLLIEEHLPDQRESPLAITLVQSLLKGPAMELVLQKGVELGVARIIPLLANRSVNRPSEELSENRLARWRRIAIEATEQCGRERLPELAPPCRWDKLPPLLTPGPRLLFWEEERTASLCSTLPPGAPLQNVTLITGPEGGFSREETLWAKEHLNAVTVGFGPRILRAETAALAALTALQVLSGDMG